MALSILYDRECVHAHFMGSKINKINSNYRKFDSNYRMIIIYHKKKINITEVMVRTMLCRS